VRGGASGVSGLGALPVGGGASNCEIPTNAGSASRILKICIWPHRILQTHDSVYRAQHWLQRRHAIAHPTAIPDNTESSEDGEGMAR